MALPKVTDPVNNISSQPVQPVISASALQALFDETGKDLKVYLNDSLTVALESITDGSSGADNIGATPLTGGTANTVQGIVEELDAKAVSGVGALNTHKTSADHDGRYYTESELNAGQLDNRYYTESEVDAKDLVLQNQINTDASNLVTHKASGDHDARYYQKSETYNKTEVDNKDTNLQNQINVLTTNGPNALIGIYSMIASGTANNYTGAFPSLAYFTDLKINVTFGTKNTGSSTFNLNGLGAKTIKILNANNVKQDLVGGELHGICQLQYDGTDLILIQETLSNTTSTVSASLPTPIVSVTDSYSGVCDVSVKGKTTVNGFGTIGGFYTDSNADGLADGWTGSSAGTFSLSNGEQTFTPTAQFGNISYIKPLSGRTYVAIVTAKTTDNTVQNSIDNSSLATKVHSGSGSFEKIGVLFSNSTGGIYYGITTKTSAFVPITVKQAFYVDVTDYPELVGLTNQQKLDWCLANLEYCDGMDSVRNVDVSSLNSILSVVCTDPTKFALSKLLNGVENKLELAQGEWTATKNISGVVNLLSGVVINSTNLVGSLNGGAYTLLQSNGVQSSGLINGSFTTTDTATIIYQLATPVTIPYAQFPNYGIDIDGALTTSSGYSQFSVDGNITPLTDITYPNDIGASVNSLKNSVGDIESDISLIEYTISELNLTNKATILNLTRLQSQGGMY